MPCSACAGDYEDPERTAREPPAPAASEAETLEPAALAADSPSEAPPSDPAAQAPAADSLASGARDGSAN